MTPPGFRPLRLPESTFLEVNGPFHASWDGARFLLGIRIEQRHCNASGRCHGGMIAAFCDVLLTVGSNIQSRQSRFLPTISLTCDFAAPAAKGAWLQGSVDVLRTTRTLLFASGIVETDVDGLVARTSAVLRITGEADPKFHVDRYFDPVA